MKRLLILLSLALLPSGAWAATYYVDCASAAGGDGTTTATSGAHAAWDAIADVNGASFSAGDSVLLKEGCTFRAQLIPPSSGNAGSPVTFGAYGAGAAPIIDGSDLVSPGTAWAASTSVAVAETQTEGTTETLNTKGSDTYFLAQGIKTDSEIVVPKIELAIKRGGSPTGNIWFELWATTGSPLRPTGSVVATSDTIDASLIGTSMAYIPFFFTSPPTLSAGASYFMVLKADYADSDTNAIFWLLDAADNYRGATDPYCRQKVNGATPPGVVQTITAHDYTFNVYKNVTSTTVWQTALATEPNIVFFDGTKGTHQTSTAALVSARDWYWAANVLYVYSATDPDTAYVTPGIEVGARDQAMTVWTVNYLAFEHLHFRRGNGDNNYGTILHNGYGIVYDDCEVSFSYLDGIDLLDTSKANTVKNSSLHDNKVGLYSYQDASDSDNQSYVRGCEVYNNALWGLYFRSNYWTAEHNRVHDNGSAGLTQGVGINFADLGNAGFAQHCVARYNEVWGTLSREDDGEGIYADEYAAYIDIYYNVLHDNSGPGTGAFKSNHVNIYNNTLYGNAQDVYGELTIHAEIKVDGVAAEVSDIAIKNNAVQATEANTYAVYIGPHAYASSGLSITNNDWTAAATNWYFWNATGGNNVATWNALTGVGTDLNSDPLFVSATDFRLQVGSPARAAGIDVGLKWDLTGAGLPATPDIGAYQYGWHTVFPAFALYKETTTGNVTVFDTRQLP